VFREELIDFSFFLMKKKKIRLMFFIFCFLL